MVTKIDHIGIAVKNLDETLKFYEEVLGIKSVGTEVVEEQKVKVAFLPIGDTEVELLESTTEDGPIAKFIEKNIILSYCLVGFFQNSTTSHFSSEKSSIFLKHSMINLNLRQIKKPEKIRS